MLPASAGAVTVAVVVAVMVTAGAHSVAEAGPPGAFLVALSRTLDAEASPPDGMLPYPVPPVALVRGLPMWYASGTLAVVAASCGAEDGRLPYGPRGVAVPFR